MQFPASRFLIIAPFLMVASCDRSETVHSERPSDALTSAATSVVAAATPTLTAPPPKASARTAADFDTTSAEQRAKAAQPAASAERKLGDTIASLGDPTQPGFWIKTPLVKAPGQGRIVNPENNRSSKVELIPLAGPASGGSQVSLPALQLIGVDLTDLPTVTVYQN